MTIAVARSQARRLARIDTSWTSGNGTVDDAHVDELIQEAVTQFANDVGGFSEEIYAQIDERFDTQTYFALHVTIVENGSTVTDEDVQITATARSNTTGAIVASDLQTAIRAMTGAVGTETVTWSDFKFTVEWQQGNTADGDYIKISAPTTVTNADARELIGLSGTYTGDTETVGSFPEGCTIEYTIPTDAHAIEHVEWDGRPLYPIPKEGLATEAHGTPRFYVIRGRTLHFSPSPTSQGICKVWYRGQPTDIDFDSDINLPSEIPTHYHRAIPFYVAAFLLMEQFDDQLAGVRMGQYKSIMRQFRVARGASNTSPNDDTYDVGVSYTVTS